MADKMWTKCASKLYSLKPLMRSHNSSSRLYLRKFLNTGTARFLVDENAREQTANRSLLAFVQELEKSVQNSSTDENIPRTWTRAGRRGGIHSLMQNTRPQILGFNVSQIQERIQILESVGVTGKDALSVAFEIPSHLEIKSETLKPLGEILNRLGCNLSRLFMKVPYIFGIDCSTIESNIKRLEHVGIPRDVIGRAVDFNPLIILYPVSDIALDIISLLLSSCEFDEGLSDGDDADFRRLSQSEFALRLLLQPFDGIREQVLLGENFKQVANFLREIQVSPCLMVLNNPALFTADVNKLYQAVEFLTGRPLLFEIELIQKMMINKSEVFLNFDRKVFEERVKLLKGILKTPRQLYLLLQKYFFFQGNEVDLEENIKILQKYKFENEQIANILTTKDFFISRENDLDKKLDFLLSLEGIGVELIAENSLCLLKPLTTLERRVTFAREVKKELIENIDVESLFLTDDEEFVVIVCDSSVEKYEELTGEILPQKKSKSSQKGRKKINKFVVNI